MRFLPTKVHGIIDYLTGIVLMAAPWLLGFAGDNPGAETWVPVVLGAGAVVYSLLTNYELGVARRISMKTHLLLDAVSGIFLAASPWIFNFDERVYLPHLIIGIFEVVASLVTQTQPSYGADPLDAPRGHVSGRRV